VRFAVARQDGLTEDLADQVDDGYEDSELVPRHRLAIAFADVVLASAGPPPAELRQALLDELGPDGVAELALGAGIFHAFSKLLIALGCEPEEMDVTVMPTPGSNPG
jgi:alkylhydroperoxidase family enzyme